MCVDLHMHSTYSDGTRTPAELVRMAGDLGLRGMAITDHDTVAGVGEAMEAGGRQGIPVLAGLEISALHQGRSLHILGYGIDPDDAGLRQRLARLQEERRRRNRRMLQLLDKLGIVIRPEELQQVSGRGQAGRPHIARLLMAKGVVASMEEAFDRYLGTGKPAWSKRFCYEAGDCIQMIHRAGGIAVWAHPGLGASPREVLTRVVAELAGYGLDGLEIYYPAHSADMRATLHFLAGKYQLVATGGSDYHGDNRPGRGLAADPRQGCPPDHCLEAIERRRQARS